MNHQILLIFALVVLVICVYLVASRILASSNTLEIGNRYNRGYAFAASALFKNESTPDKLLDLAIPPFHRNEFDEGVKQAVRDFIHYEAGHE